MDSIVGKPKVWLQRQPRQRRIAMALVRLESRFLWTCLLAGATTLLLASQWLTLPIGTSRHDGSAPVAGQLPISPEELAYGLAQCERNGQRPVVDYGLAEARLAQLQPGKRTVLRNATLLDGDGTETAGVTITMQGSLIVSVRPTSEADEDIDTEADTIVQLDGRIVTPGLVDAHSHAGVRETPQLWSTEDVTEISSAATPWARAIDGLKPQDQALGVVASGGVTTSLVLTGAKNLISGEGVVIKMKGGAASVREMLVEDVAGSGVGGWQPANSSLAKPQRYLKMAMGENQKRQFQGQPGGPSTRLGSSFWVRRVFEEARTLMQEQDRWCRAYGSEAGDRSGDDLSHMHSHTLDHTSHTATHTPTRPYPSSIERQTLVDVLRGDIRVNAHGYETEDLLATLDHADEFGFGLTAWHHALHADVVLDELRRRDIALVAFSDSWGDKKELYRVSSRFPARVVAAGGVPLALTRDHPALHGQFLLYEAQIAHHFGLDGTHALAAIMAVPARLLGLDHRVGHVRPGYDADVVVWDRHPLRVGAAPLQVFIDGRSAVRASDSLWTESLSYVGSAPGSRKEVEVEVNELNDIHDTQNIQDTHNTPLPHLNSLSQMPLSSPHLIIHGISTSFLAADGNRLPTPLSGSNLTAVIRDGRLVCIGDSAVCFESIQALHTLNAPLVHVHDGYLLPGLTILTKHHGLVEMVQEPSTTDGHATGDNWDAAHHPPETRHGLKFDGLHLGRAHRAGITRIVTPPLSHGFFHGISARFRPGATSVLDDNAVSDSQVALHFTIGHEGKSPRTPSISAQIGTLHDLLVQPDSVGAHPVFARAARGELPVVVHTQNKDVIGHAVALQRAVPAARIVIAGGAEAHLLAAELAAARVPVLVAPFWGCEPLGWDARHCLPGPPLVDRWGPQVLLDAGVIVGIASWDDANNHVRNSLWEAGWLASPYHNLSVAVDLLSRNVEIALGLPPSADLLLYESNPFEFGARVALTVEAGRVRTFFPDPDGDDE
ncbi:carbohydrate esterase family 9 protein [Grosmannia clavigera kw1407]|uniref:Carbohydrate esterase family 9 protein n=1 Tax=Grosmannia clavigera (strain kw1407 / UAMH 11150) TaxID=655863 RepID=F0X6L0_GROCL|nr:carbohydrate esterase family 9 protein [Grosmannia clavigera kw1407]EFX06202.1 carbohydrate esterase family 9 protein [Grosmannia clavigera kw1407]